MFVRRSEELATMYVTKRDVNLIIESARLDSDPTGLDYDSVVEG